MVDPPEAGELKLGSWSELGVIISFANASSRERASYVCLSWLAVHDFAYVIFPLWISGGSLSNRLASTPHFSAPPLIYHPCQCRASAAAPGDTHCSRAPQ